MSTRGEVDSLLGSATQDFSAAGNAEMDAVRNYFAQATQNIGAADNAEMGAVRDYFNRATQNIGAAGNAEIDALRSFVNNQQANPYVAATNPLMGLDNAWTGAMIDAANRDTIRNYNELVAPKFSMASSFDNANMGSLEALERANINQQLADTAARLRWQDYALQAGIGENWANRTDTAEQFNRNLGMQGYGLLGQLGESYAGRTDAMANALANRELAAGQSLGQLGESYAGRVDQMANALANRNLAAGQSLGSLGESYAGRIDAMNISNANRDLGAGGIYANIGMQEQQLQQQADQAAYQRQLAAAQMQPSLVQAQFFPSQQLLGIGNQQQALSQAQLTDEYDRWYQQNYGYPQQQLEIFGSASSMFPSGIGSTTVSGEGDPWGGALAGGLLGMQAVNAFFGR
jgi:hypothetical protein